MTDFRGSALENSPRRYRARGRSADLLEWLGFPLAFDVAPALLNVQRVKSLLLCAWLSTIAAAATLEQARDNASKAAAAQSLLEQKQKQLAGDLDRNAREIETLKLRSGHANELQHQLELSQALSAQLTGIDAQLEQAHLAFTHAQTEWLHTVDAELDSTWAQWEHERDVPRRRALTSKLLNLHAERARAARGLVTPTVPNVPPAQSDDPQALTEEADALRDAEDKARQRLEVIAGRVREEKKARELERRMGELVGDQSAFDDHDRNLRAGHDPHEPLTRTNPSTAPMLSGPSAGVSHEGPTPPLPSAASAPGVVDLGSMNVGELEAEQARLQQIADALQRRAAEVEARARSQH